MLGYEESDRQRGVKVFLMNGARSMIVGDGVLDEQQDELHGQGEGSNFQMSGVHLTTE